MLSWVTEYAALIGKRLEFSPDELRDLYFGAILHDIGKIGVHEHVLNKSSQLETEEVELVQKHPYDGITVIEGLENLRHIIPTVRHHHERWDGLGYPDGLKGEEIPLHARIVAVADAYDAMTSDRAYRLALPDDNVTMELRAGRGKQFDPRIIDLFLDILRDELTAGTIKEVAVTGEK